MAGVCGADIGGVLKRIAGGDTSHRSDVYAVNRRHRLDPGRCKGQSFNLVVKRVADRSRTGGVTLNARYQHEMQMNIRQI